MQFRELSAGDLGVSKLNTAQRCLYQEVKAITCYTKNRVMG